MLRPPHSLSEITDPAGWLLKEHFFEFRELVKLESSRLPVGRAFNMLVDDHQSHRTLVQRNLASDRKLIQSREVEPREGIVVAKRSDIGISPYASPPSYGYEELGIISNYAIRAGSLVVTCESMVREEVLSKSGKLTCLLAMHLSQQFARP